MFSGFCGSCRPVAISRRRGDGEQVSIETLLGSVFLVMFINMTPTHPWTPDG